MMAEAKNVMISIIKDSGDRTEFSTGAVRDMREGKGRCDLMPLEVVAKMHSRQLLHRLCHSSLPEVAARGYGRAP